MSTSASRLASTSTSAGIDAAERVVAGGEAALELRQVGLRVRARQRAGRPGLRALAERAQQLGRDERAVDREEDGDLRLRCLQAGDDAGDRRLRLRAARRRRRTAARGRLCRPQAAARTPPRAIRQRALRQRLAPQHRERLRRPEPRRRPADEQDARDRGAAHETLCCSNTKSPASHPLRLHKSDRGGPSRACVAATQALTATTRHGSV